MSGDGQGGYDCWAGNGDPFSCADGLAAKKTGETHEWDGLIYERYTCCSGAWRCRRLIPHEAKSVPQYSLNSLNLLHPLLHCMGMIKHLESSRSHLTLNRDLCDYNLQLERVFA